MAAAFTRTGEATDVVQLTELPIPSPGPGEVLVKMVAASMHPADRMFIRGAYRNKPVFPQCAGLVGTGVVIQADSEAGISLGARVSFRYPGTWAEYCAVPAERLYEVPSSADIFAASQFALNPLTAWGVLDYANVAEGDWIAVNAAGSNVAAMIAGLAKARGIRVLKVHRTLPSDDALAVASGHGLAARLVDKTGGEPIAALLDSVGGGAVSEAVPALRPGATIVSYGLFDQEPAQVRNSDMIYRNLTWKGFGIDRWISAHADQRDAMIQALWTGLAQETVPAPVRATFPLSEVDLALRADNRGGTGKVLLRISEAC